MEPTPLTTLPATIPAEPTGIPTVEPTLVEPTMVPTAVPTVGQAGLPATTPLSPGAQGQWLRFSSAEGLCSNSPVLIGGNFVGTGSTTFCYADTSVATTKWPTATVPIGTRVTAAVRFPPGGGLVVATDAGICNDISWQQPEPSGFVWECQAVDQGFPYLGIRGMTNLGVDPVYMLADAIAYGGRTYNIPGMVGAAESRPTWIAVSGEVEGQPRIWAGTNGHGVLSIDPQTGTSQRYTTADGLPGNSIRDVTAEPTPAGTSNAVWVATDGGVGYWDGQSWTAYTTANGLPSDDVRGISSPGSHTLWVATAAGPAYFDGSNWRAFTRADGVPEGDINGVFARGGEIWFSTVGYGLIVFVVPGAQ